MGTFHRFLYRLVVYTEYNLYIYIFSLVLFFISFYAAMPKGVRHHESVDQEEKKKTGREPTAAQQDRAFRQQTRCPCVCVCVGAGWIELVIPRQKSSRETTVCQVPVCPSQHTRQQYEALSLFFSFSYTQTLPPTYPLLLLLLILFMNFLFSSSSSSSEQPVVYYTTTTTRMRCTVV